MELVIGTKAWSSWSMRPWLALKRMEYVVIFVLVGLTRVVRRPFELTGTAPA